jgi:hypothetical protein
MKRQNSITISTARCFIYRKPAYCRFLKEVLNEMYAAFEINYLRHLRNILYATIIWGGRGRKGAGSVPLLPWKPLIIYVETNTR